MHKENHNINASKKKLVKFLLHSIKSLVLFKIQKYLHNITNWFFNKLDVINSTSWKHGEFQQIIQTTSNFICTNYKQCMDTFGNILQMESTCMEAPSMCTRHVEWILMSLNSPCTYHESPYQMTSWLNCLKTILHPNHYEKLHSPKPHYLAIKIQKTIHIQLLCNYPLNITTIMQLSL